MTSEKRAVNGCATCGAARWASAHIRGSGVFDHEYARPVKPRQPQRMAARSQRGQDEFDEWQERKAAHLLAHPTCEVAGVLPGRCYSPTGQPDVHHISPRSMGGTRYDEDTELITACRAHHDYIESHRDYARVLGLLKSRRLPPELRLV